MKNVMIITILLFGFVMAHGQVVKDQEFEFVFMTDIHLKPEMNAPVGFQMAIDKTNEINPDFVLTGGDNVYDVMRGNQGRADTLFSLYTEMIKGFDMPVYSCVGNHDLFAIYAESPEGSVHPDYKYGMFQRYLGETYYSFDHKGWHFIVLNSLDVTENQRYKGEFNSEQMEWLKKDIAGVDQATPVVIVTHLPMLTLRSQIKGSEGRGNVSNSHEVFQILENHNLKLILQGHIHWKEHGMVNDKIQFITGGSIAGNGWKGRRHNTKEGFLKISVKGNNFTWEYVDHGWEKKRMSMEQP